MAPEQAKGRPVDKRSDVWAFGAVLFEMMTGTRAFEGDSVSETLACVIEREPAWKKLPLKLAPTLRACLERCLQKDPRQRIRDIGDVRLALEGAFESSVQPEQRSAIAPSRGAVWIAFFLAALAAAGLAVAKWWDVPGKAAARNIVTFTIPPPPNTFFREVAISPDGSHVVFSVTDRVGKRALWSRRLESLDLEPLAGTEGAQLPFWSPDNRFIGFNVGARLFKFDLARGSVQLAGNTGGVQGAAWRRDGSILFGQNLGGLYQLRPDSTNAQAVTTLDATHKESRHYWPVVLPDNRHFLFVVASALPDVQGIWVASMDNPSDRHRLLSDLAMPAFSAGHLFFVRGDTLMAQPFDPVRSALGAEAVPVLGHVTHQANTGYGAFSVAANGSVIALSQIRPWRLTWYDRAGRSLGVFGRGGLYRSLSLSPDEQRVAVDGDSDTVPGYQLFVIDHQRDTTTQLTVGESTGNFPTWSPDGRQLAFGSNRDGVYNIYLKQSSGAGQETSLVKNDQNKFVMDWSRDGRFLLYGERRPGTNRVDLWTLEMTGKRTPTLYLRGAGDQRYGRFSPDGRWVAYQSDESSRPEVYVQSIPSGADKVQISVNGGMHPVWRADGTELYYLTQSGMLMAVPVKPGTDFRAGLPVPLFQTWQDSAQNEFAVTRDGRFIFPAPEDNAIERPATMILNWH
jgi:eukaryotic-like serine/threonine-protein kinase